MASSWRSWRWLALALLLHCVLAGNYARWTPAWEGPDENDHAYYAWFLDVTGRQPAILKSSATSGRPAGEEAPLGHHPPLYYLCLRALTHAFGAVDHAPYWSPNPAWATADPSGRLKWRHGVDEVPPRSAEMGVLGVLRGFSVGLGALSILFAWLLARELFPARREVADGAALLLASVPQWAWMHGVLDNGNLATALTAVWLWWLARALRRGALRWDDGVMLGAVLGLALLTKLTALFLLPLLCGAGLLAAWRWPGRRVHTLGATALAVAFALALASPWFVYNWQTYGDPLALAPHAVAYAENQVPAGMVAEYLCGDFVVNTLASAWAGVGWTLHRAPVAQLWVVLALAVAATVAFLRRLRAHASAGGLPLLAALGAIALTVAGLVKFNLTFLQPQGRYLFPAFGALAVLAAATLPARGLFRGFLLAALALNAAWLPLNHFLPPLVPPPLVREAHYASFIAGLAADAPEALRTIELLSPAPGERVAAAPTFRWRDPAAVAERRYSVHIALPGGQVLGTFETTGQTLEGDAWAMPPGLWDSLPAGVELRWRVRAVPDRSRGETATAMPASAFVPLARGD